MTTTRDNFSRDERVSSYSLMALTLLADPVSILLDRDRLTAIADLALRYERPTTRGKLTALHDCAQDLRWLRPKLKHAFTTAYAEGDVDAASTQRLVDRFELWSD